MSSPPPPPPPSADGNRSEVDDLRARLDAERDGTAYWREVARQRRVEAARVQHRPVVRAAIALDRRTARPQRVAQDWYRRLTASADRAALGVAAARSRSDLTQRRRRLAEAIQQAESSPPPTDSRSILVIHLGDPPPAVHRSNVKVQGAGLDQVDQVVLDSDADLVCLLGPWSTPLTGNWLDHLAAAVTDATAVAVPQVVHGPRARGAATPDDLLVQSIGLVSATANDGAPGVVANAAGASPDPTRPSAAALGAGVAGLVMRRSTWVDAGGLGDASPSDIADLDAQDLDAAVLDLCLRVHRSGGGVATAPMALLADDRRIDGRTLLTTPLPPTDDRWRSLVDHHGAAVLHRSAHAPGRPSVTITTATPSMKIAPRSGDWHYAQCLAGALRRADHQTLVQTVDRADSPAGRAADVHLVLRGLEPVRRTEGQRHVLWVISHPEALEAAECDAADLVVVASARFADHLRTLTDTPVEVLLQATDPGHFRPRPADPQHQHRVTVVANSRGVDRRMVLDAMAAGLTPAVYGTGWEGGAAAGLVVADYIAFDDLPSVYSSAGVVLNDHWDTMRRWGFVSNRIFDVAACGVPVLSDHLVEIEELFGDLVPMWQDPDELAALVVATESDPDGTRARTEAARALVLGAHTFDHRVNELMGLLAVHGLIDQPGSR